MTESDLTPPELTAPEEAPQSDWTERTPQEVARYIVKTLGETESVPIRQIALIVRHCGIEKAIGWLQEAQRIEANGGMLVADQSRRRTLGGVFFFIARGSMKHRELYLIFNYNRGRRNGENGKPGEGANLLPKSQKKKIESLNTEFEPIGKVDSVTITIVGRPGHVELREPNFVITRMTHQKNMASFPNGLPSFPEAPTEYIVYIAFKQWQKIEAVVTKPDDMIVVEGAPVFDAELGGIVVYALSVTTQKLRKAKETAKAETPAEPKPARSKKPAAEAPAPTPDAVPESTPALAPDEHYAQLKQRADELQARINEINALPFSQRKGLVELVKELQAVKTELDTLAVR